MRREDFNNALNHIDIDLVEEYVTEKERAQKKEIVRKKFVRLAPLAACFAIFLTVGTVFLLNLDPFGNSMMAPDNGAEQVPATPGDNGQMPNDPSGDGKLPSKYKYYFYFNLDGQDFICLLNALDEDSASDEMNTSLIPESQLGELLATVEVADQDGEVRICKIYGCLYDPSRDEVAIEISEGVYLPAQRLGGIE